MVTSVYSNREKHWTRSDTKIVTQWSGAGQCKVRTPEWRLAKNRKSQCKRLRDTNTGDVVCAEFTRDVKRARRQYVGTTAWRTRAKQLVAIEGSQLSSCPTIPTSGLAPVAEPGFQVQCKSNSLISGGVVQYALSRQHRASRSLCRASQLGTVMSCNLFWDQAWD